MKHLFYFLLGVVLFASCKDKKTPKETTSANTFEGFGVENTSEVGWGDDFSDLKIYYTQSVWGVNNEEKAYYRHAFVNVSETYFENGEFEKTPLLEEAEFGKDTIVLNGERRKTFLRRINVSEEDNIHIFNPETNFSVSFQVGDFPVMAFINGYYLPEEATTEDAYHFVFDLGKSTIFDQPSASFCYIGKENPFVEGKMERIVWKPVEKNQIPSPSSAFFKLKEVPLDSLRFEKAYEFKSGDTHLIAQEWVKPEAGEYADYYPNYLYLLVLDAATKNIQNQYIFTDNDFAEVLSIHESNRDDEVAFHLFGKIFKGKSPALLNLQLVSIGCENIYFTDTKDLPVRILCDNRH